MTTARAHEGSRYRPESLIATGGMGEVWRATDTVLHRAVALKILKPEYAEDPAFRERFAAEARHAASLQHPGVAAVFDFGELPPEVQGGGSRPYLVMELVDGQPLSSLLRQGPRLDPEVARDLVGQAAEALAAAHATGLVHRDVKPANLLVTPDRRVKVTDFGIARAADGVALTRTGQLVGTPQYLSPEQADGRQATPASDVYALGVVLFQCLTGRQPFTGDTPVSTALAHLRQPVPDLPDDVPADLAAITRRALAKEPAERYADGGELAAALRTGVAVPAPPAGGAAATQVLTGVTPVAAAVAAAAGEPVSDATTVLAAPREERRWQERVPPWWPVALMGLLAVLLVVALVVAGRSGQTATASHRPTATPSSTPSATPTPKVRVRATDYVGHPAAEVRTALSRLGLRSRVVAQRTNPGGHVQGTVATLSPTGPVAKGTRIRLTTWGAPPPPPQTQPPPKHAKPPKKAPKKPHHGPPHGKHKGKGH
ncbi:MAG TPA: serine/threonine-protein kinase [Marmoricola sp.]|nr:serine/threonine-protein kinase [Marmoricola sp.]